MASKVSRVLLVLSMVLPLPLHLLLPLPMISGKPAVDTCKHVRLQAEEATPVQLRSLEQRSQEESNSAWKAPLLASSQHWQLWAVAGVLLLVFGLFWRLSKRSHQSESGCKGETRSSTEDKEEANEGEDSDDNGGLGRIDAQHVHGAKKSMAYKRQLAEDLVSDLLGVFRARLADRFFAVLEPAIGVGSAFEGWNPRGHDAVYRLLVPLKPPRGHTFHLELGSAKNCVRVQLECSCRRDQGLEDMLCFVHDAGLALKMKQDSSILSDLCTGYYLDVQKIARWFQTLVSSAWREMPQWHRYSMKVLPSRRSCKLQLTNDCGRSFYVEVIFGVQQGDSDIFLSGQAPEQPGCFTPGTTWAESYAVAEAKFFRRVAKQAPHDTCHLKCLQLCAGVLEGTSFSNATLKTVVMHLLNALPPESWTGRAFIARLQDVTQYLRECLQEKCLYHFFLGHENVPQDITLPPASQAAEPLNLFQCLAQDPAAHAKALRELQDAQERLTRLLF